MDFKINVDPANAQRGLDDVSKSFDKMGRDVNGILSNLNTGKVIEGLDKVGNVIRQIGSNIDGIQPQTKKMLDFFSDTISSATQFAKIGQAFGPEGALVGGIIGAAVPAFEALYNKMQENEEQAAKLAKAINDELNKSFKDLVTEITNTQNQLNEFAQVERGLGTIAQQTAHSEEARNRVTQARIALNGTVYNSQAHDDAEEELRQATAALHVAEQQEQQAYANAAALEVQQRNQRDFNLDLVAANDQLDAHDERVQRNIQSAQRAAAATREWNDTIAGLAQGFDQMLQDHETEELRSQQTLTDLWYQDLERRTKNKQAFQREQAAADKKINDDATSAYEEREAQQKAIDKSMKESFGNTVDAFVGGTEQMIITSVQAAQAAGLTGDAMTKAVLNSIRDQAGMKALYEAAEALASFAGYAASFGTAAPLLAAGIGHTTAAAMYGLVAGGTAIASEAMGNVGGGGSGANGSSHGPTSSSQPTQSNASSQGIVININGGFSTSSEIGLAAYQAMVNATRAGQIRRGDIGNL